MSDQAYRLKSVRFRGQDCLILLQNENGPCPLLAAANALLLQQKVKLPASAIRNNVASLSDLTNVLANFALQSTPGSDADNGHFYFDELLQQIPKLQDGMDVNPKFTAGITGYEYTQQLTCFDLWHVKLVHGWLLDPAEAPEELFEAVGNRTYNELIELIVSGKEAETRQHMIQQQLEELQLRVQQQQQAPIVDLLDDQGTDATSQLDQQVWSADASILQEIADLQEQLEVCQKEITRASYIDHFLQTTSHQLTQYGLSALHQILQESEVTVFFRNNHFATLTKHEGSLFLLVTDLGYANTPMVVWERLDVIDGDTEYVNSQFMAPGQIEQSGSSLTPEQLMAQSSQNDADYHLALALSSQPSDANVTATSQAILDTEEGKLMAAATEASLREFHGQQATMAIDAANGKLSPSASTAHTTPVVPRVEIAIPVTPPSASLTDGAQSPLPFQPSEPSAGALLPATMTSSPTTMTSYASPQEATDALLAQQLADELQQQDAQTSQADDWALARQLQDEEEQRAAAERQAAQQQQQQRQQQSATTSSPSTRNNPQASNSTGGRGGGDGKQCVIS